EMRKGWTAQIQLQSGQPLYGAFDVDFRSTAATSELFDENIVGIKQHEATFIDRDAHYWEVLASKSSGVQDIWSEFYSPKDRLSLGWVRAYRIALKVAEEALNSVPRVIPDATSLPPILKQVFQTMASSDFCLQTAINEIERCIQESPTYVSDVAQSVLHEYPTALEWSPFQHLPGRLLVTTLKSSTMTKCGLTLPWVDSSTGIVEHLQLDASNLQNDIDLKEYWFRIPDSFCVDWGRLLSADDVPISFLTLAGSWKKFRLAEEPAQVVAAATALLEEASANKIGTIPPGAVVDLSFGPFSYIEFYEAPREVFAVCRTKSEEFFIVSVEPSNVTWALNLPSGGIFGTTEKEIDAVVAGIKLLLAAVIRDFWIVEQRERVFGTARRTHYRSRSKSSEPRIIYLPRIRYREEEPPNVDKCVGNLGLRERRAHFVTAHFRRAEQASQVQLVMAERYGFRVPEGYTFVRPHERGKQKREVFYRSRSALASLYDEELIISKSAGSTHWFQFERDVHAAMEKLGFVVQHIAAARRGDGGVDLYATKGSDLDLVNWIVSCKCWGPKHAVGPSVVRDLIGALKAYPPGTRGMVVTTSRYTSGAQNLAEQEAIRLMDGVEFLKILGRNDPACGQPET
ncbi:MAG: restriction endonuclease, partial [Planctomycetota bacterium]